MQFWTELSLIILMVGTLISGIQQFGEAIASGISFISPDYTGVFVQGSGRLNMAIGVLCVCVPLIFINGLRQVCLLWWLSTSMPSINIPGCLHSFAQTLTLLCFMMQLEYAGDVGIFINQVLHGQDTASCAVPMHRGRLQAVQSNDWVVIAHFRQYTKLLS